MLIIPRFIPGHARHKTSFGGTCIYMYLCMYSVCSKSTPNFDVNANPDFQASIQIWGGLAAWLGLAWLGLARLAAIMDNAIHNHHPFEYGKSRLRQILHQTSGTDNSFCCTPHFSTHHITSILLLTQINSKSILNDLPSHVVILFRCAHQNACSPVYLHCLNAVSVDEPFRFSSA